MSRPLDAHGSCWREQPRPHPALLGALSAGPLSTPGAAAAVAALRREYLERPAVFVGAGTCGLGAGAGETAAAIRRWLAESGAQADLLEVGCIGLCSEEPLVDIQLPGRKRLCFSHVTAQRAPELLARVLAGGDASGALGQLGDESLASWEGVPRLDEHPFFARQRRQVLACCGLVDPQSIDEAMAHGAYSRLARVLGGETPESVCDLVERSGLRGRGGGGFRTGTKWKLARQSAATTRYLVCNADEGDPGAFMDRAVIEGDPHRLIEGMAIAAYALGAQEAYVYIRAEYPLAIARLERAIADARAHGLLGRDILGSGFHLELAVKQGAGAFVCGEETALLNSIEGRRGMPRPRPPYPTTAGLFGKPTVINNVETLANVPGVMDAGGDGFAEVGTASSKGTKVFALSGKVSRTGLVEVPMGITLEEIVFDIGGGVPNGKRCKAVQIGGPSGGCIPRDHMDVQVDYESLKKLGAMMGSGGLVVMDEETCMVDLARFFMEFIQGESCGKCIPCREGTGRMLEILQALGRSRRSERGADALHRFQGLMYLQQLADVIRDTSLCGLGQSAPNPVLSTLRWFRDEYEAHIYERRCPARVCTDLLTYRIDTEACRGCMLCLKACPTEAVQGVKKAPHYIVQERCIGCGACAGACNLGAVVVE